MTIESLFGKTGGTHNRVAAYFDLDPRHQFGVEDIDSIGCLDAPEVLCAGSSLPSVMNPMHGMPSLAFRPGDIDFFLP